MYLPSALPPRILRFRHLFASKISTTGTALKREASRVGQLAYRKPYSKMKGADDQYNEYRTLGLVTLTSIATIIGSGILALPITLYETGLRVFLAFFTLALIAQFAIVVAMVELLQHAAVRMRAETAQNLESDVNDAEEHVSLYMLSRYYLPTQFLRAIFHGATVMCFVAILVSYGLAGPQAVNQMLSPTESTAPPPLYFFAIYWLVGTGAVVFFLQILLPVFGSFTVVKGTLFGAVIVIVAMLPQSARPISISSLFDPVSFATGSVFVRAAAPFLMSSVALGGLPNTLCVTYALLPTTPTTAQILRFRNAVFLALFICYVLNIGWVFTVLQVVPRRAPPGTPSLQEADLLGQISTVPLLATLNAHHAVSKSLLHAVDTIVELFILVSTGVSYFVMSAGLKNFIDGFAADFTPLVVLRLGRTSRRAICYATSFGVILFLVLSNPKGFISALTRFTSLVMNLQCGVLIFLMLYFCRSLTPTSDIEAPVSYNTLPHKPADDNSLSARPAHKLTSLQNSALVVLGIPYFSLACLLAMFGPMLGIQLGAHE